jgi:hypothetical protein
VNPVDAHSLQVSVFQPLHLKCDILVSKFGFSNATCIAPQRGEDQASNEGLGLGLNNALGDAFVDGSSGGGDFGDEDEMDIGGAWWHVGGLGAGAMVGLHKLNSEVDP